ncbi:hypothetical protein FJY63_14240 [Candidatus Sumerlaeota bacterium]|nr:hypothetical protein [Candidatus Sumerlaeota bacterium]
MSMKREISESQFIQRIQWKESDWPSWRVNLDESWCSPDVWNDRLQEFFARKLAHMDST